MKAKSLSLVPVSISFAIFGITGSAAGSEPATQSAAAYPETPGQPLPDTAQAAMLPKDDTVPSVRGGGNAEKARPHIETHTGKRYGAGGRDPSHRYHPGYEPGLSGEAPPGVKAQGHGGAGQAGP